MCSSGQEMDGWQIKYHMTKQQHYSWVDNRKCWP